MIFRQSSITFFIHFLRPQPLVVHLYQKTPWYDTFVQPWQETQQFLLLGTVLGIMVIF